MKTLTLSSSILGAVLLVASHALPANAQATRTWVSGVGVDGNPCSRTAPCKTFAFAIGQTAAGGQISVLDPGGYGGVTITKSISIVNDGSGEAGILASGSNAIVVSAGATDVVHLRGLVIDGATPNAPGLVGIKFNSGAALHVHQSTIKNFTSSSSGSGIGISFSPSGASELYVTDTVVANNGSGSNGGAIMITPTGSGSAKVVINRSSIENNVTGITNVATGTSGPINTVVVDTVSAGASFTGFSVVSPAVSALNNMMITRTRSAHNTTGISSFGNASVVLLSNSSVTGNSTGLAPSSGGQILSYGNNEVNGNTSDGAPTGPVLLK